MAFTVDDFQKIWASTSPLTPYEFSESNYKEGWNFVGGTPPSRQMWDFMQKQNDEKTQWLYNAHNDIIDLLKKLIPTGCVQSFAGNTLPDGWLLCDGSAVSRTDYAELYAVIGDTYGAGDGSTTFNLPDLTDKFIQGNAVAGTEHSAGLPNITGSFNNSPAYSIQGAFSDSDAIPGATPIGAGNMYTVATVDFKASNSNSIYGSSTTVQPPSVTMRYIIKY